MKFKKSFFLLAILTITSSMGLKAQQHNRAERVISIDVSKSVSVPADLIVFNINLNIEAETPKEAFDLHREKESLLASLLKDLGISEKNIKYQPININKKYRNDNTDLYSQTMQSISVTFDDFSLYERIQLTLIENGFDSFDGRFSSTKLEEGKTEALELVLKSARERAEFIANNMNVKLGEIKNINYYDHEINNNYVRMNSTALMKQSSDASMMDFEQSVSVNSSVHVTFSIN